MHSSKLRLLIFDSQIKFFLRLAGSSVRFICKRCIFSHVRLLNGERAGPIRFDGDVARKLLNYRREGGRHAAGLSIGRWDLVSGWRIFAAHLAFDPWARRRTAATSPC